MRLSMGGEPTFVAVDDMNGAEWNTAAAGPNNAYEAEGRRLARFDAEGHAAGAMQPRQEAPNIEYPMILDLRRSM